MGMLNLTRCRTPRQLIWATAIRNQMKPVWSKNSDVRLLGLTNNSRPIFDHHQYCRRP